MIDCITAGCCRYPIISCGLLVNVEIIWLIIGGLKQNGALVSGNAVKKSSGE